MMGPWYLKTHREASYYLFVRESWSPGSTKIADTSEKRIRFRKLKVVTPTWQVHMKLCICWHYYSLHQQCYIDIENLYMVWQRREILVKNPTRSRAPRCNSSLGSRENVRVVRPRNALACQGFQGEINRVTLSASGSSISIRNCAAADDRLHKASTMEKLSPKMRFLGRKFEDATWKKTISLTRHSIQRRRGRETTLIAHRCVGCLHKTFSDRAMVAAPWWAHGVLVLPLDISPFNSIWTRNLMRDKHGSTANLRKPAHSRGNQTCISTQTFPPREKKLEWERGKCMKLHWNCVNIEEMQKANSI